MHRGITKIGATLPMNAEGPAYTDLDRKALHRGWQLYIDLSANLELCFHSLSCYAATSATASQDDW